MASSKGALSTLALVCVLALPIPAPGQDFGDTIWLSSPAPGMSSDRSTGATDGHGVWIVAWRDNTSIRISLSADDGETWGPATYVFPGDLPSLASDGADRWILAYEDAGSLYARASTDDGATWSAATLLGGIACSAIYEKCSVPDLEYNSGTWLLFWSDDTNIRVRRSTDGGTSWSPATSLGTGVTQRAATDGRGNWIVVWANDRIEQAVSTDDGVSWTSSILNPDSPGLPPPPLFNSWFASRLVDVGTDRFGSWVVAWTTASELGLGIGTELDIVFSRSTDLGATWSSPKAIHRTATRDQGLTVGNPDLHDYCPSVAADDFGNLVVAWQSEYNFLGLPGNDPDVVFVASSDGGESWGLHPRAFAATDYYSFGGSEEPQLIAGGTTWLAVWESDETWISHGDYTDVFVARAGGPPAVLGFELDPTRTYLRVGATDTALDALVIPLLDYGIHPLTQLRIEAFGDFDHDPGDAESDARTRVIGVFARWPGLLPNPPALPGETTLRIPDPIASDAPAILTDPTADGSLPTDIPQDFVIADSSSGTLEVTVTVPFGARFLYIAAHDDHYVDNSDPDHDFAVRLTRVEPVPALGRGGLALLLVGLASVAVWQIRRRAA